MKNNTQMPGSIILTKIITKSSHLNIISIINQTKPKITSLTLKNITQRMNQNKGWSVYDTVPTSPNTPENLMADINSAISALESSRSITFLEPKNKNPQAPVTKPNPQNNNNNYYDAKLADESYKAGLACLASGKLDEAVESLNTSLSNCPPDETTAVAKLQSLISVTSQQLDSAPKSVS